MNRYNITTKVRFHTSQDNKLEAKKRLIEILVAVNKMLPPSDTLVLADTTTADMTIEQLEF